MSAPTAPVILTLRKPITRIDKTQCTVVALRHYLTAGDVMAASRDGGSDSTAVALVLVARVTGLDAREVDDMDIRDVEDAIAHIEAIRQRDPKA